MTMNDHELFKNKIWQYVKRYPLSLLCIVLIWYLCTNSITPLMSAGASQANRKSFQPLIRLWLRRYSYQITEHVPPYMIICVHLSANCTSSKGVSGKNGMSDSTQIRMIQKTEKGYLLICCRQTFILSSNLAAKLRKNE